MSIATPRFGGCLDSTTAELDFCALSPTDCIDNGNDGIYVKPDEISQNRCSGASQVEVGRCASAIDEKLCTFSKNACQISPKYGKDGTCNIINDTSGAVTRYPYCRVLPAFDPNKPFRCVLSDDDCTEKEMFIPLTTFTRQDPCYCHHVPTGICYLSAASKITADSSFCAVDEYDCPKDYLWMSAQELLNMESPPRYCRLCHQGTSDVQLHEHVVEAGGCYKDTIFLRCALQSTDCDLSSNEMFKSSPEMRKMGHVPCAADETRGGECTSSLEDIDCTNAAESCLLPQKFVSEDSCTMHLDKRSGAPTWFGHCQNSDKIRNGNWENYRCVWKDSECDIPSELWYPASGQMDWFGGCNCEDVVTGACKYEGKFHCAVSELGCADPSTYLKSNQLEDVGMSCHLCHPKPRTIVNTAKDKLSENPDEPTLSGTKPTDNANLGAIIGGSIAGVFVMTSLAIFLYRKRKTES